MVAYLWRNGRHLDGQIVGLLFVSYEEPGGCDINQTLARIDDSSSNVRGNGTATERHDALTSPATVRSILSGGCYSVKKRIGSRR